MMEYFQQINIPEGLDKTVDMSFYSRYGFLTIAHIQLEMECCLLHAPEIDEDR